LFCEIRIRFIPFLSFLPEKTLPSFHVLEYKLDGHFILAGLSFHFLFHCNSLHACPNAFEACLPHVDYY
jgi:hypothetical protein